MIPPPTVPAFLARHGWAEAAVRPLAGDASFRRYFRVEAVDGARAVLMDAPPEHEDCGPFLAVARQLRDQGFRAPDVLAAEPDLGLVLLEDFGDRRMREALAAEPALEERTYARAVDLLTALHRHPAGDLPPYDLDEYLREVRLFADWYMAAVGLDPVPGFEEAWAEALAPVLGHESVTVLRDYHAENIMLLPHGDLGLLDFQDALAGHPAYDLVSLLQDARRDVHPELEARMLDHHGTVDRAAYALLGAQRNTKILGIFTRLAERDGKAGYLRFQPRMWGYLERDLLHPAVAPVRAWFDRAVPAERRALFWAHRAP